MTFGPLGYPFCAQGSWQGMLGAGRLGPRYVACRRDGYLPRTYVAGQEKGVISYKNTYSFYPPLGRLPTLWSSNNVGAPIEQINSPYRYQAAR